MVLIPGVGGTLPVEIKADFGGGVYPGTLLAPAHAILGKDSIRIDMELRLPQAEITLPPPMVVPVNMATAPPKPEKKGPVKKKVQGSRLSGIFPAVSRAPEPVYFQSFDCVGMPSFFFPEECRKIVEAAEEQGFTVQRRHRVLNLQWTDLVDPFFAEALWQRCGLEYFLRKLKIDGMVACGLNDVIRIQKYVPGSVFGRHIDQHINRLDGRVSKYSLRVYLNGQEEGAFDGGLSMFHVPFRPDPVIFEPEMGLALLYPQGDLCIPQEETELIAGCKYVLRADILFRKVE